MSSTRLPGKVCLEMEGIPLLKRVCDRVSQSKYVTQVLVATSVDKTDDAIEAFCTTHHHTFHRGPLHDVARRFIEIIDRYCAPSFIRICADSPLIDAHLIDQAVELFDSDFADVVTNTFPRSFPKGQSVEVVRSTTFRDNYPHFSKYQKEHITSYFYDNQNQFSIVNFSCNFDFSSINHSIDTMEDFARVQNIIKKTNNNDCNWIDYVNTENE